ncbi:MAG TPA: serine hydrolase [Candidatus Saccharimonadales bacterium]|nr:serine hydrolase [Candidatus Saccharimonadales bacterium]
MRHQEKRSRAPYGIAAAVLVFIMGLGTWNVARPLPAVAVTQQSIAEVGATPPDLTWPAPGEVAVEVQNVTTLLTHGEQKPLPTASIAKVITALTVLQEKPMEAGELGPTLTLTQQDLDIYNNYVAVDGSVVRVAPGEQLTEYQALQALMLPSANNIADTLAIWAFGSLDAYHAAAVNYVKQIGMADTTIGPDASGLSPETKSTPADLVRLGEQAMSHPVLSQIVGQKSVTLPIHGPATNVNFALGKSGIVGIKTGNIDEVGGNLLFAAKAEISPGKTVTIIGVVMGQPDLTAAVNASPPLIDSVRNNLYMATPIKANETIATYTTAWGATANAVAKKDVSFVAWKGTAVKPKVALQKNSVSYQQGAAVGTISATAGSGSGTSDIVMTRTLDNPSFWWRLTRH